MTVSPMASNSANTRLKLHLLQISACKICTLCVDLDENCERQVCLRPVDVLERERSDQASRAHNTFTEDSRREALLSQVLHLAVSPK